MPKPIASEMLQISLSKAIFLSRLNLNIQKALKRLVNGFHILFEVTWVCGMSRRSVILEAVLKVVSSLNEVNNILARKSRLLEQAFCPWNQTSLFQFYFIPVMYAYSKLGGLTMSPKVCPFQLALTTTNQLQARSDDLLARFLDSNAQMKPNY